MHAALAFCLSCTSSPDALLTRSVMGALRAVSVSGRVRERHGLADDVAEQPFQEVARRGHDAEALVGLAEQVQGHDDMGRPLGGTVPKAFVGRRGRVSWACDCGRGVRGRLLARLEYLCLRE